MSERSVQLLDSTAEVHSVLTEAVADFGPSVLSNATILEGVCEDRLPECPREVNLISNAARADVATMLAQQVAGVGPDTAVRLSAASLASERSLDPDATLWVVSEFARALGYPVSDQLSPAASSGSPSTDRPPPSTTLPSVILPPRAVAVAEPGRGSETLPPEVGLEPPRTSERTASRKTAGVPRRSGPGLSMVLVAMVALYLVVAGVASLPPFAKTKAVSSAHGGSSTHGSSNHGGSSTSGGSSNHGGSSQPTPAQLTLAGLVPDAFKAGRTCTYQAPTFGAVAQINCPTVPNTPAGYVNFYLFSSTASLSAAYGDYLADYARTSQGVGHCGDFRLFMPICETGYGPGTTREGRIVEYDYQGDPDLTFTVDQKLLLIDIQGGDGDAVLQWWAQLPSPWISAGSGS